MAFGEDFVATNLDSGVANVLGSILEELDRIDADRSGRPTLHRFDAMKSLCYEIFVE